MKRDELASQVMLEIFRGEIRWYHWVTPEARNIVTDRVRTDIVRRLAEAGKVDIGTAEPGSYSVPILINREGPGSTSPEPGPEAVDLEVALEAGQRALLDAVIDSAENCTCNGQWTCCYCTGCAGCSECEAGPDGEVAP